MRSKFVFLLFFVIIACTNGAKILGVFNMASYSHHQMGDIIMKNLAAKGHQVTVITPFAEKEPIKNMKQVVLTGAIEEIEKLRVDFFKLVNIPNVLGSIFASQMGLKAAEDTLNHPNVQKLLASDETFDLVIMETFFNEALIGFCHRYNAPRVSISSVATNSWINPQVGNPGPPSYVPELFAGLKSEMNFFERVFNAFVRVYQVLLLELYNNPKQNNVLHKYFPDAPHLSELYHNTSLVLINSHVSLSNPVPLVPNMIEIGGFHVKAPKKLPDDLQEYLDNAKNGAILFSMGSNVKSEYFPTEKRDAILKVFSKLKVKVLWKWENENLPGKPENVKISKWLPQQDILAHPNIKLFITHGGFLSTIETVYHGVPVIGIPIYGDQKLNIVNAENAGYGIRLDYDNLNEETFGSAINEMLSNPSYTNNVRERSKILHDQPEKPLDRAIFWVEYVLRHKGAPHLKTAILSLNWYQYLLLDVVAFVVFITFIVFTVICLIFKKLCCKKKCDKKISQSKKKN